MPMRPMTPAEARSLLREAVRLNITHRKTGRDTTQFSDERDEIATDLATAGYPTNYADYDHPSDVE